jgi:hypothetical protein
MLSLNFIYSFLCFLALQIMIWFSTNLQFVNSEVSSKSFQIMLVLAIPISMAAYFGTKFGYEAFNESAWSVRFFGFALSYLTFPIFTWLFLGESMFSMKTTICIALSFIMIAVQLWL